MAKTHSFDTYFAARYGLAESVFLSQICFWVEKNAANGRHYFEGRYWTYNTMEGFNKMMPYMSVGQLRRIIEKLCGEGVLYRGNYNRQSYDRTLWYSVSEETLCAWKGAAVPEGGQEAGESDGGQEGAVLPEQEGVLEEEAAAKKAVFAVSKEPGSACFGGESSLQNCQMHMLESTNAYDKIVKCICWNQQMHVPESANAFAEISGPIPDQTTFKPSSSSFSLGGKEAKETEEEGMQKIKQALKALDAELIYSRAFYAKARAYMAREALGDDYLAWVYERCMLKKPKSLSGYYYAVFFSEQQREGYREGEARRGAREAAATAREFSCPVCGARHSGPECSTCGFRNGADDVSWKRRLWALGKERRDEYLGRHSVLVFEALRRGGIDGEFRRRETGLNEEFGLPND